MTIPESPLGIQRARLNEHSNRSLAVDGQNEEDSQTCVIDDLSLISQNMHDENGLPVETVLSVSCKYECTPRESTIQIRRELHHFTRFKIAIRFNRGPVTAQAPGTDSI